MALTGSAHRAAPIEVERACADLVNRYALLMDEGPAVDGIELFGPEPTLRHHTGETFTGRETLHGLFAAKDAGPRVTRHVTTNIIISMIDDVTAAGSSIFTLYDATVADKTQPYLPVALDGPAMIGTYADRFILTPNGWRFDSRDIAAVFRKT